MKKRLVIERMYEIRKPEREYTDKERLWYGYLLIAITGLAVGFGLVLGIFLVWRLAGEWM